MLGPNQSISTASLKKVVAVLEANKIIYINHSDTLGRLNVFLDGNISIGILLRDRRVTKEIAMGLFVNNSAYDFCKAIEGLRTIINEELGEASNSEKEEEEEN